MNYFVVSDIPPTAGVQVNTAPSDVSNNVVMGCMTTDHAHLEKNLLERMDKLEEKLDLVLDTLLTLPQVVVAGHAVIGHDTAKARGRYGKNEEENIVSRLAKESEKME